MKSQIAEIRARFEAELQTEKSSKQKFHPIDIERVRTEDWQIERYLLEADGNLEAAYSSLLRTLSWKASFGIHTTTEAHFPSEFYHLYAIEKLSGGNLAGDLAGRPIFSECFTRQRRYGQLEATFRRLVAVSLEAMDRLAFATGQPASTLGVCYLGDFSGTPLTSLDVSLAKFRVELLNEHYPLLARRIILHNVPALLRPVLRMIVAFLRPSLGEAVVFTSSADQLARYIHPTVLPLEVGGLRAKRVYPAGTLPLRECYESFGLKEDFVDYYYKYNEIEQE